MGISHEPGGSHQARGTLIRVFFSNQAQVTQWRMPWSRSQTRSRNNLLIIQRKSKVLFYFLKLPLFLWEFVSLVVESREKSDELLNKEKMNVKRT